MLEKVLDFGTLIKQGKKFIKTKIYENANTLPVYDRLRAVRLMF